MKKKGINPFRVLAVCGCIAAGIGVVLNLLCGADFTKSVIPYTAILSPWINGLTVLIGILLICKPQWFSLLYTILFVQSLYAVFTGFDTVGIFLYAFLNLLLFCNGFFKIRFKLKLTLSLGIWFLALLSLITFSWDRVFFGAAISLFVFGATLCIYHLLMDKLSYLLPDVDICRTTAVCTLPEPGSTLCLQDLGLTERQQGCIKACLKGSESYKDIGERYFVSESAIKKEMSDLFRFFGVKNREMLRLLLMQYKIDR
jgi:DNA-binding CsgD family transcriptional regulator